MQPFFKELLGFFPKGGGPYYWAKILGGFPKGSQEFFNSKKPFEGKGKFWLIGLTSLSQVVGKGGRKTKTVGLHNRFQISTRPLKGKGLGPFQGKEGTGYLAPRRFIYPRSFPQKKGPKLSGTLLGKGCAQNGFRTFNQGLGLFRTNSIWAFIIWDKRWRVHTKPLTKGNQLSLNREFQG